MRCPKSVTPKKVEANRRNAKLSTGPRTERGRHIAKFNAVTLGLFAKHVVIPCCDGYNAEKDFQSLLDGLHQEFQPIGSYEEWLVVEIAECMWRLRRATRFESGAVREAAIRNISSDNAKENDEIMMALVNELHLLDSAEKEIRDSGSLSRKVYDQVAPLLETEKEAESVLTELDHDLLLTCIMNRKRSLDSMRVKVRVSHSG